MSRSSEVLFFPTDIGCLGECFQLPFLSFPGRGCCLLSTTAQHIKRWASFSPLAYIEPHLSPKSTYTLSIGSL